MSEGLLTALSEIVGSSAVLHGAALSSYSTDWRGRYHGLALAAVFPSTTQQVADCVRLCTTNDVEIVPQGGNTSLCGASVPLAESRRQQIIINLSRMNSIRALDAINYTMTVDAGCKLAAIYAAADQVDRLFPLGLTAIAPHCEIGGNISTNAGGIGVLRYGNARDLVLGLEVVLPDGNIWNGLRSLRKDNTGYDLKQLFIGAEGTLGIITGAVLKLFPRHRSTATACFAVREPAVAVSFLAHMRATCGDRISSFEIISRSSLELVFKHIPDTLEPFENTTEWIVITHLGDVTQIPLEAQLQHAFTTFDGKITVSAVTSDEVQAEQWWRLRKNISEAQKLEGISIKHDVSVGVSRVAEFIERADAALHDAYPGVRIVAFGHMGDGNIHYNVSMHDAAQNLRFIEQHEHDVNRIVYEVVKDLEGSISAEHGLGQLKRDVINDYKSDLELDLMRRIKRTLDPGDFLNPGKVI